MWLDDPFWLRAARQVAAALQAGRTCFAPAEFHGLGTGCLPLAFAHGLDEPTGVLILPKGDVDQLPLTWIRALALRRVLYADEVFVGIDADQSSGGASPWQAQDTASGQHLPFLRERVGDVLAGRAFRTNRIDGALSTWSGRGKPVIVVSAAMTGNAGDRLMTDGCLRFLKEVWPDRECLVSNGDLDRSTIAQAAAIVIGPGGMLYDSDPNGPRVDLQNVANYFRFGYLAAEYGIDLYVLGVGDQGNGLQQASKQFIAHALRRARLIATRDRATAAHVAGMIDVPVLHTGDFSERLVDDIRQAAANRPSGSAGRLVLCGDFRHDTDLPAVIETLASSLPDLLVDFVVQANEDLGSLHVHRAALERTFTGRFRSSDVRSDHRAFVRSIASADVLITTRFHATMIALMAGIDSLVFHDAGDKRDRAVEACGRPPWMRTVVSSRRRWTRASTMLIELCRDGRADMTRGMAFEPARFDTLAGWMRPGVGGRQ